MCSSLNGSLRGAKVTSGISFWRVHTAYRLLAACSWVPCWGHSIYCVLWWFIRRYLNSGRDTPGRLSGCGKTTWFQRQWPLKSCCTKRFGFVRAWLIPREKKFARHWIISHLCIISVTVAGLEQLSNSLLNLLSSPSPQKHHVVTHNNAVYLNNHCFFSAVGWRLMSF